MSDTPDLYADCSSVTLSAFGAMLNFGLVADQPNAPPTPAVRVRVSYEHLKVIAFLTRRLLREHERQHGIEVMVPGDVLNQMRIGREDWDECWGQRT